MVKANEAQIGNLVALLDDYAQEGGHHPNVNIFSKEALLGAQAHPEKYPQLTVRVSGYTIDFNKLTKERQDEVISRTSHGAVQSGGYYHILRDCDKVGQVIAELVGEESYI